MPSRYTHTSIKKNKDGKRVFKPTIYPKIPIKDSDIFIYPKPNFSFDLTGNCVGSKLCF